MRRRTLLAAGAAGAAALATRGARAAAPTRVVILGTKGGPRITPQAGRGPTSHVLVAGGVPYVIDCGSGVADRLVSAGVELPIIRHIFLTHHHSDHNLDYGNLFLLAWAAGLRTRIDTWGPPPIEAMTRQAFEANMTDITARMMEEGRPDPRALVFAHEFVDSGPVMRDENVSVTMARVQHGVIRDAFAYRFDTADRSVVFSGDTAKSDDVARLAKGADVLIHEAIYLAALEPMLAKNPNAPTLRAHLLATHTTAEQVGMVAAEAGVKKLVLSHLVPGDDPSVTDAMWIAEAARHYAGPIVVARDGMEV